MTDHLSQLETSELPDGYVPYVVDIQVRCVGYPPSYSNRWRNERSS